jgi:hypothetical protein
MNVIENSVAPEEEWVRAVLQVCNPFMFLRGVASAQIANFREQPLPIRIGHIGKSHGRILVTR